MRNTAWKGGFLQYSFRKISLFFWQNSMVQRVSMINSNKTQLNSDYDFSMLRKWLLWNQGGVESKTHFSFDVSTKRLSAGADIAVAYILCTRPSSSPIPNQQFLAHFEFTGTLDFLNITDGDKIFIEIKENLIKDPTLIEDLDVETNYAQGLGIGEIKMAKNYPGHNNYLKLYEWNWGKLVDHRKEISIPALDSVSQRTTTLEEKVSQAEEKVGKLEEAGTPDHLWIKAIVAEAFKENDEAYEYHLPLASEVTSDCPIWKTNLTKEIHIPRVSTGVSFNTLELYLKKVWEPSQNLEVEIRKAKKVSSLGLEFVVGNEVLATGSVRYSEITTAYQMKTVTLSKEVTVAKDEFIIIVLKQQGGTVNGSNYFCIGVSKNPSLGYGVICVESEEKQNKTYANVVCNSQWWHANAIFGLWGSSFTGHKKWTLPDRYNFSNWFPKNSIQEIVAPADNLTIKFKVKCSNWKTSGWGGSTRWGFSIILWNQTLASYGYNQTVETTTTATLSTRMLESSELYIQGNSENYSTYYTGCDVEISREITSKPWEILARSIYSRKAVSLWEKWEFTVFGCHQDMTWKWEDKLPAWPFIVALSGYKSWNSTDTKQFKCPKDSFCKMGYNLSSNYYWDSSLCHIKLKKDWKEIQSLSRNSNGSDSAYFILPKGVIDVEIYSWNTNWGDPSMSYSILIQTDLPS